MNMFCEQCGAKLEEGDVFCVNCGAKVPVEPPKAEPTERAKEYIRKNKEGDVSFSKEPFTRFENVAEEAKRQPKVEAQPVIPVTPPGEDGVAVAETKSSGGKLAAIVAVILVVAILAGGLGGFFYKRSKGDSLTDRSNDIHQSLGAGFTDISITDPDSAMQAVESVSDQLGISDPKTELQYNVTQKYGNNKYYRMQQYYNGVPVYGRDLVVGTNKNGGALSLNTNYRPISKAASKTPTATKETVRRNVEQEAVKRYNSTKSMTKKKGSSPSVKESAVSEKRLTYYDFGKGKETALAYSVPVQVAGETVEYLADANTGEVLEEVAEVPVPNTEILLINRGEPGALRVAYEDLFADASDSESSVESASDPTSAGLPVMYKGDNWAPTSAEEDNGNIHVNYTVFNYAVTLMLNGLYDQSEPLTEDQVIDLLVRALLQFNLDETMQQAASTVYAVAVTRNAEGALSDAQLETVRNAFASVGLPVVDGDKPVDLGASDPTTPAESGEMEVVKSVKQEFTGSDSYLNNHSLTTTYDFNFDEKTVTITHGDGISDWLGLVNLNDLANMPCLMANYNTIDAQDATPSLFDKAYLFLWYSDYIRNGQIDTILLKDPSSPWSWGDDIESETTITCKVENGLLKKATAKKVSHDQYDENASTETLTYEYIYEWNSKKQLTSVQEKYPNAPLTYKYVYDSKGNMTTFHHESYSPTFYSTELSVETTKDGYISKRINEDYREEVDTYQYTNGKISKITSAYDETKFIYSNDHLTQIVFQYLPNDNFGTQLTWTYSISY